MTRYDRRTALVVVDVQNDFADPGGGLSVRGGDAVVPVCNQEARAASRAGAFVVYTQDWHPAVTPHFAKDGGVWPVHCVAGTWGAAFQPALEIVGPSVRKGSNGEDGYSGFTMRDPVSSETIPTALGDMLGEAGVTNLVVCGLATDYCVKATVLDGRERGYPVTVLGNAIRAVDLEPTDGDRAVEAMLEAGALLESRATVGGRETDG